MKICCTCQANVPLTDFCKNKNTVDGLSAQCKACAKNYRDSHKAEKVNYPSSQPEYRKEYLDNNKDHINELRRVRHKNNPMPARQSSLRHYFKNRASRLVRAQKYYLKNKLYLNLKNKEYRTKNHQYILLANRRRTKRLNEFPNILQSEIDKLLELHGNKCAYCGIAVSAKNNLHLDHKTPLSRQGTHTIDNLVPACATCNLRKGTKTAEEFLELLKIGNK